MFEYPDLDLCAIYRFSVDGSGQITTQAVLDRESVASYEINLVASDMDTIQPRQSTTLLVITVDDINDQNPYFTPETQSVDVVESVSVSFVLLTVTASDDDIGTNADVLYSILPSSNPVNNFGIGASSGLFLATYVSIRYARVLYSLSEIRS